MKGTFISASLLACSMLSAAAPIEREVPASADSDMTESYHQLVTRARVTTPTKASLEPLALSRLVLQSALEGNPLSVHGEGGMAAGSMQPPTVTEKQRPRQLIVSEPCNESVDAAAIERWQKWSEQHPGELSEEMKAYVFQWGHALKDAASQPVVTETYRLPARSNAAQTMSPSIIRRAGDIDWPEVMENRRKKHRQKMKNDDGEKRMQATEWGEWGEDNRTVKERLREEARLIAKQREAEWVKGGEFAEWEEGEGNPVA